MITIGLTHTSEMVVTEAMTAKNMGSGDMPVLATPAMIALMENAALLAVANELEAEYTTVGGQMSCSHLRPTKIGDTVSATATVTKVEGKKIEFHVEAHCKNQLLGEGSHLRFIVDRKKFLERMD